MAKKIGTYTTLKEARKGVVAREWGPLEDIIDIFEESDGSFSLETPKTAKAKLVDSVDRAGRRYEIKRMKRNGGYPYDPSKKYNFYVPRKNAQKDLTQYAWGHN